MRRVGAASTIAVSRTCCCRAWLGACDGCPPESPNTPSYIYSGGPRKTDTVARARALTLRFISTDSVVTRPSVCACACRVREWHAPARCSRDEHTRSRNKHSGAPRRPQTAGKHRMGRVHLRTREAGQLSVRGGSLLRSARGGDCNSERSAALAPNRLCNEPRAFARSCCKGGRRLTPLVR